MKTNFYHTPGFRHQPTPPGANPPPDRRSLAERARDQVITWFGDIKLFQPLPFLPRMVPVYDPGSYRVTAAESRALESILLPGDILLRGYTDYLDGMVIPGFFSHAGLYLGEIDEDTLNRAGFRSEAQAAKDNQGKAPSRWEKGFATGKFMVAHSMAEGVFTEDIIGFCRADFMAVVRIPRQVVAMPGLKPYRYTDKEASSPEAVLQERLLAAGETGISFVDDALPVIRAQALSRLGAHYDFSFDFRNFNDMSCTEYVHWSTRCLQAAHGIMPVEHRMLLVKRLGISPDDIVLAKGSLQHLWSSKSISAKTKKELHWRGP